VKSKEGGTFERFGLLIVNWKFLFIFLPIFHSKRSCCLAILTQTYFSNTNVFFIKEGKFQALLFLLLKNDK